MNVPLLPGVAFPHDRDCRQLSVRRARQPTRIADELPQASYSPKGILTS
jgi:hypothetical protein